MQTGEGYAPGCADEVDVARQHAAVRREQIQAEVVLRITENIQRDLLARLAIEAVTVGAQARRRCAVGIRADEAIAVIECAVDCLPRRE